jgi:hypothetical protein
MGNANSNMDRCRGHTDADIAKWTIGYISPKGGERQSLAYLFDQYTVFSQADRQV